MNFKTTLLTYVEEGKQVGIENHEDMGYPTEALEKAYELTFSILNTRFENELKQYNQDEEKAYDEFIAKKNLDYLRIYINEFLLLDKKEEEVDFYKAVKKHMNDLLNNLHLEMKNGQ